MCDFRKLGSIHSGGALRSTVQDLELTVLSLASELVAEWIFHSFALIFSGANRRVV